MMRETIRIILGKLASFRDATRGQVVMTFALAAMPMLIVVGTAVDYSRAVAARSMLQQATDSTVLAITHSYLKVGSTSATLLAPTQTYLAGVMNKAAASSGSVTYNGVSAPPNTPTVTAITLTNNNTQMCLTTAMIVPTALMQIVNKPYLAVGAYACSQVGGTYEVALVLDNSYSMAESAGGATKMASLQQAAANLVDILIPDNTAAPTSAISLVPFNAVVNTGASKTTSYIDSAGKSSIHWQNFNIPNNAQYKPASKFDLYTSLNVDWGGCVEERPAPYTTTDTAASASNPDTLFVPYFAPDDPGQVNNQGGGGGLTYEIDSNNYLFANSYLKDSGASSAGGVCSATGNSGYKTLDQASSNIYPGGGLTMACKYQGASAKILSDASGLSIGPNFMCSTPAITPLTTDKAAVKNAINAMAPTGSTNLSAGFMWGWRTISPIFNYLTVSNVTTIGQQNPKPYVYGPPQNTKVIILMTDGFNSWTQLSSNPFKSTYESFGYMVNNRLSSYSTVCGGGKGAGYVTTSSTYRCQMDNVLSEACTNAKAAGVVIYTVGFTISSDPIDTQGINLLKGCASSIDKYYQATSASEIVEKFQEIASSIQALRLSD